MLSLIQAVKMLDLPDSEIVYFVDHHNDRNAPSFSVKDMRSYLDMRSITVRRISPYHFMCSPDISWEFSVSQRDMEMLVRIERKKNQREWMKYCSSAGRRRSI